MSNDPHCQQTPKFLTLWSLRKAQILWPTIYSHLISSYTSPPPHRRHTYVMLPLSELLWHHILHSPIPVFADVLSTWRALLLIVPCPKSTSSKPSPLQFLKQKSNCTPTSILSRTAFLRQISLYDIYLCTCLTELLGLLLKDKDCIVSTCVPHNLYLLLFWMEHMDLQCWWINKINLVIISF